MSFNFNIKAISPVVGETSFDFDVKSINPTSSGGGEEGYTELEYIESTGTQYIDTGIDANSGKIIECDCMFTARLGNYSTVFGGRSDIDKRFSITRNNSNGHVLLSVILDTDSDAGAILNVRYLFGLRSFRVRGNPNEGNMGSQLFINGKVIVGKYDIVLDNDGYHIYLFGDNRMGVFSNPSAMRVYSYKVTDIDTGEVLQDLKPVQRNSDGVLGLYDSITKTLFTNAGTGDFVAGYKE